VLQNKGVILLALVFLGQEEYFILRLFVLKDGSDLSEDLVGWLGCIHTCV